MRQLSNGAAFAPIGLIKMFNSGGAIKQVDYESSKAGNVGLKVRGSGTFGAYSSVRPKRITLDDVEEHEFDYEESCGLLTLGLPFPERELYQWSIAIEL